MKTVRFAMAIGVVSCLAVAAQLGCSAPSETDIATVVDELLRRAPGDSPINTRFINTGLTIEVVAGANTLPLDLTGDRVADLGTDKFGKSRGQAH
jgi:hypothetical protein